MITRTSDNIQIGIIAAREPVTGKFLEAVPIYAVATPELCKREEKVFADIGSIFAKKFEQYRNGESI